MSMSDAGAGNPIITSNGGPGPNYVLVEPVSFWHKPLTVAVITTLLGFALTSVIGFIAYTNYQDKRDQRQSDNLKAQEEFKSKSEEARDAEKRKETRIAAVHSLAEILMERRIRQELLISSYMRRASLEEIIDRKRGYDSAFADWNREFVIHLSQIQYTVLQNDERMYGPILKILREQVQFDGFSKIDFEITQVFDLVFKENTNRRLDPIVVNDEIFGRIRKLASWNSVFRDCTTPLVQTLVDLTYRGEFQPEDVTKREKKCAELKSTIGVQ